MQKDDVIYRQAAIELIKNYCENGCDIAEDNWCPSCQREQFIKLLKALPSAQPETAKRIVGKSRGSMTMWFQCDICNEPVDEKDTFCSGCGRRFVNG